MSDDDPKASKAPAAAETGRRAKASAYSRYLIPLAAAILVGIGFLVYYLTYVQQHREYLLNRNYRVLATLGEQMSETLANQVAALTSYVDVLDDEQFDENRFEVLTYKRSNGQGSDQPIALAEDLQKEDGLLKLRAEIHSFAPRLNHVLIRQVDGKSSTKPVLGRRDGEWMFQLAAVDPGSKHEASATISLQDLSQSFSPSIMDTFDDVLLASADGKGEIIFQKQRIGPHFSSLSDLLKSAAQTDSKQVDASSANEPKAGSSGGLGRSFEQLFETNLAGVPYMVFLEPVTIDLNPRSNVEKQETQRLILAGLVPSRRFRWETLAISYWAVILSSSVFLLFWLSTPIIKIFFFNERERVRLRDVVLLPMVCVVLAGVLTSLCLQTIYFNLRHDDTDSQLENLSSKMAMNVKGEIRAMRDQLVAACKAADKNGDLRYPHYVVRTSVVASSLPGSEGQHKPPYPYFSNIFWTDAGGRQTVKWSAAAYATPLIDISGLEFFRNLDSGNHYFFLDDLPFRLDSVLPPNQENYAGPDLEDAKFAFLSTRALSLIDPTLPLGFGFALVDDTGTVLFHSDKYRNNRENFLVETSYDRELTASLYGHSNEQNFSLDYRGNQVRARVVPIPGVTQAPWSLIVYRDARYVQTYQLEIITMAGTQLLCYLIIPTLIVCCFYVFDRPRYVPDWLWPSERARLTYRFQIEAGLAMLALSAALIFLRGVEESLYAAAAVGYVTLIVVLWSNLAGNPLSRGRTLYGAISGLAAVVMVAIPIFEGWWWSAAAITAALMASALALRGFRHVRVAHWRFPELPYRAAYYLRALVLLTVIGILPPLSFFRNSMLLEDHLHVRAAQLHAAMAWSERERMIQNLNKDVPGLSKLPVPGDQAGEVTNRCGTTWDRYLGSYFETEVTPVAHDSTGTAPLDRRFHGWFLRVAHDLHHSYNDIGAEALGVLRNPSLPEDVYADKSPVTMRKRAQDRDLPEWEWLSADEQKVVLLMHLGADASNPCSSADKGDLLVSSTLPSRPNSAGVNVSIWFLVIAIMGVLYWRVTQKILLFDIRQPLSHTAEAIRKMLEGDGHVIVLPASRQDWTTDLVGDGELRIDIRRLAPEPDWAAKFDDDTLGTNRAIVVENFDWELGYPECDGQRLILLERLVTRSRKVIVVSAVDPFPFLVEQSGPERQAEAVRWAAVLGGFTRVNLAGWSSWAMGEQIRKQLPAVWEECSVQPELHRIGGDLMQTRKPGGLPDAKRLDAEQVVSEVLERASEYYFLEWRSCTPEECFVLAGLAEDGMVNPKNAASLRQLLRRRLIVRSPQFRIMNESFRRFVRAQSSPAMRAEWDAEAAGSGWGKARGAFSTVLVLAGLFLLATQQQFLQTSAGLLTAVGGCVTALLKVIGVVRGSET